MTAKCQIRKEGSNGWMLWYVIFSPSNFFCGVRFCIMEICLGFQASYYVALGPSSLAYWLSHKWVRMRIIYCCPSVFTTAHHNFFLRHYELSQSGLSLWLLTYSSSFRSAFIEELLPVSLDIHALHAHAYLPPRCLPIATPGSITAHYAPSHISFYPLIPYCFCCT